MPQMTSIPEFKSARLKYRPLHLSDASRVQLLAGHPKIAETTATIPHPYLDGIAEQWIASHAKACAEGRGLDWGIELISQSLLIGNISCFIDTKNKKMEIGYWMGLDFWGQGYMTEALISVRDFLFQNTDLNKITCRHIESNPASGKVMLKAGLKLEGRLKQEFFRNGKFQDMIVYGLTRDDYQRI